MATHPAAATEQIWAPDLQLVSELLEDLPEGTYVVAPVGQLSSELQRAWNAALRHGHGQVRSGRLAYELMRIIQFEDQVIYPKAPTR